MVKGRGPPIHRPRGIPRSNSSLNRHPIISRRLQQRHLSHPVPAHTSSSSKPHWPCSIKALGLTGYLPITETWVVAASILYAFHIPPGCCVTRQTGQTLEVWVAVQPRPPPMAQDSPTMASCPVSGCLEPTHLPILNTPTAPCPHHTPAGSDSATNHFSALPASWE